VSDVHNKSTRSYNMSQIKGKDTKPELLVRRYLHANGFRYRLHVKTLPGKPDLVLTKYKTVIFINGCFWHAHEGCKYFKLPKSRSAWWEEKLLANRERDQVAVEALKESGWKVIVVWECELKPRVREERLERLINDLKSAKA
jgi:DNA mismatch endonuclease (patch repair protein)